MADPIRSPRRQFAADKHFKLELQKDFPPVRVNETSTNKDLTIEPGKTANIHSGFYIHQDGTYLINFEITAYSHSLMMLPSSSSHRTIGPIFKLINHSEFPVSIPAHKKLFKVTFLPLENDVDICQDLPLGQGCANMEESMKDVYSLNYVELQDAEERQKASREACNIIAEAVKPSQIYADSPKPPPSTETSKPSEVV